MKNSVFLFGLGILISIFRLNIEGNKYIDLIFVMALINVVAFDYVILIIFIDIRKIIVKKIYDCSLPNKQKEKCEKRVNVLIFIFSFLIFIVFSLVYVIFLRSASFNDILAIMALMISISQNQISEFWSKLIYKII